MRRREPERGGLSDEDVLRYAELAYGDAPWPDDGEARAVARAEALDILEDAGVDLLDVLRVRTAHKVRAARVRAAVVEEFAGEPPGEGL